MVGNDFFFYFSQPVCLSVDSGSYEINVNKGSSMSKAFRIKSQVGKFCFLFLQSPWSFFFSLSDPDQFRFWGLSRCLISASDVIAICRNTGCPTRFFVSSFMTLIRKLWSRQFFFLPRGNLLLLCFVFLCPVDQMSFLWLKNIHDPLFGGWCQLSYKSRFEHRRGLTCEWFKF